MKFTLPGYKIFNYLLIVLFTLLISSCDGNNRADIIFYNGSVLTVNEKNEVVESLVIKDGTIIFVGLQNEAFKYRSSKTKMIDLAGKSLLPGFIAVHEHPTLSSVFGGLVDVSGFKHKHNEEVWNELREAAKNTKEGEWIYAMGLDSILVPDLKLPTKEFLDSISSKHPIIIIAQSLHSFWANSKAFEELGITKDTPDPEVGSYYHKNEKGELSGLIVESKAVTPFLEKLKSPFRMTDRYEIVLNELLSNGFTSVASLGYNLPPFLAKYVSSKNFHPRIRQFFYLVNTELKYLPEQPDFDNKFFRINGIKLWHDGSPYMGGMYMEEPYNDNSFTRSLGIVSGSKGKPLLSEEELTSLAEKYMSNGWQVSIHSQGDKSNRDVLNSLRNIKKVNKNLPIRVEHSLLLPKDLMKEMGQLGITPSFHINHIYYYGDTLMDSILGEKRTEILLPVKAAFENNLHPTLHADSPMFPANAFSLMKTAITRKTKSGQVIGKDQSINIYEALRAMTINGAYQLGVQENSGSLEVGKWADLQILDKNPYNVSAESLEEIKVIQVFVNGKEQIN